MQLSHAEDSTPATNAVRGGARQFKTLLTGDDGSPNNYKLSFVRQSGKLDIPRHRHNFDQLRMCLEGERQNYGAGKWINPGEIVYFPEGTPYGPEQSESHRLSITLQFGGASGSGYIGPKRTQAALDEMKAFGTFDKGVFTRTGDLAPGQRRNQDSYEAMWEHVNGRKLTYPKPRYSEPVLIKPDNFEWLPQAGQAGVGRKLLAVFSESRCEISMLKLDAQSSGEIGPRQNIQIGFVTKGSGKANGQDLRKYSAFSLAPNERCAVASDDGMELLIVRLPIIASSAAAA